MSKKRQRTPQIPGVMELLTLLTKITDGEVTDMDVCRKAIRDTDVVILLHCPQIMELVWRRQLAIARMIRGDLPQLEMSPEDRVQLAGLISRYFQDPVPTSERDDSSSPGLPTSEPAVH